MFFPLEQREVYLKIDGEQLDANTGFYNLRARWMNPAIGRFQSMDSYAGDQYDPLTIHKYSFTSNNPINDVDPSGNDGDSLDIASDLPKITWPAHIFTLAFSYGLGSTIIEWADGQYAGFNEIRTGVIPWRDHNPGNVTPGGTISQQDGMIGVDKIPDGTGRAFSIFPDDDSGDKAMKDLLLTTGPRGYQNLTLKQALKQWNLGADNAYIGHISKDSGIGVDTPLNTLTGYQLESLMMAMKTWEGFFNTGKRTDTFSLR